MGDPFRARRLSPFERIRGEVNSRCASLRSAACLLLGLPDRESEEMLRLMAEAAFRLARSLKGHRRNVLRK